MSHHDYPDSTPDRRTSTRIPIHGPVRMGPPHGEPYATVSASDLSKNGLFIDADRPVRVGARFSAEIALANGELVYIPEAEVAYNRERDHGSGFGVRFIDPPSELVKRIDEEISRVLTTPAPLSMPPSELPEPPVPSLPPVSVFEVVAEEKVDNFDPDSATEVPAKRARRALADVDMTKFPEPAIDEDALVADTAVPAKRTHTVGDRWEDLMRMAQNARHHFVDRARRSPSVWTGLAAMGLSTVLAAVGLALWMGSSAEAVEATPKNAQSPITPTTHAALMGEGTLPAILPAEPKPVAQETAAKPLPPLVVVDDTGVVKSEEPEVPLVAPTAKKPAKLASSPAVAPAVARAAKSGKSAKFSLTVAPGASVLRTHVLKAPDRYVIDIAGQKDAPAVPTAGGAVKQIRVGRHPDHVRIVIETSGPIDHGKVSKNGKQLSIALELVR